MQCVKNILLVSSEIGSSRFLRNCNMLTKASLGYTPR